MSAADIQLPTELTILNLAKPFLPTDGDNERDVVNGALLAADLAHYRDLFSKLRFSYVEQVTKEKFLKAIMADPPAFVDATEHAQREKVVMREKADLKERKDEVRGMIEGLHEQGRSLAGRYERLLSHKERLDNLPQEIAALEHTIAGLEAAQEPRSENPNLNLPLAPTMQLLEANEAELADLDRQIEALQHKMSKRKEQIERLEDDLVGLQTTKDSTLGLM